MACLPIDYITSGNRGDTVESVWRVLKWSFDAMYQGKWPKTDWNNKPWSNSKHDRHRKKRRQVAHRGYQVTRRCCEIESRP